MANAGIARRAPLEELSDERWDATHDVDLKCVMRVCRAAAPAMRRAGRGSMFAVSSIMGVAYGWDEHAQYSAAKAGMVGLVRALAVELAADGVRVNAIAPGYIRTAQSLSEEHSLGAGGTGGGRAVHPDGARGRPRGRRRRGRLLGLRRRARYLTGQIIVVDGGLLVGRY